MEIQGDGDGADAIWSELLGAAGTSQLPGDLMMQIVTRLPVKSILRFKSVCKAWYSLFSHPNFIQHHSRISNSFAKMNNLLSFFVHTTKNKGNDHLFSLLLDRSYDGHIWIDLDLAFKFDYLEVVGSVNGLVCLTLNTIGTSIMLWNPATRKHWLIPNPQLLSGRGESVFCGFVYDHRTDIYKVVRVVYLYVGKGATNARVEIYSTEANIWRTTTEIVGFPWNILWLKSSVVVGGDLYWFSSCRKQLIMSFDASLEVFTFHPVPPDDKPCPLDWHYWRLDAMGDHPALTYCKLKRYEKRALIESLNIRKLNKSDDGSLHIDKLVLEHLPDFRWIARVCGNGKIIAADLLGKLLLYDHEETKYLSREMGEGSSFNFYDYTESCLALANLTRDLRRGLVRRLVSSFDF